MTIRELIELLEKEDKDKEIKIYGSYNGKIFHPDGNVISSNSCIGVKKFHDSIAILREI